MEGAQPTPASHLLSHCLAPWTQCPSHMPPLLLNLPMTPWFLLTAELHQPCLGPFPNLVQVSESSFLKVKNQGIMWPSQNPV